jgi:hypothetical protein
VNQRVGDESSLLAHFVLWAGIPDMKFGRPAA